MWRLAAKISHALAGASLVAAFLLGFMSMGLPAQGQIKVDIGASLKDAATPAFKTETRNLPTVIGNYIQVFLGFLGVIALLLIIYAGYLWMTAQGNEDNVEKAKDIIKNAVIGLIIITLSYAITAFIIGSVLNAGAK